jgi:L-lactate dehydrogenase complex protein LldG
VSDARAEVLGRVREALGPGAAALEVPRAYRGAGAPTDHDVIALFCERCADYRATVRRVSAAELPAAVSAACAERGARRLVTPPGGPAGLEGLELVADDPPLGPRELDGFDGVLTGCALAIAETGTIVLDGGARSGRRAITLVPDYHVCVVEAERIVQLDRVEGVHGPRTLDVFVVGP